VLLSAVLWGTLWIPVRRMQAGEAGAAWTTALGFLLPLAVLLPAALRRGRSTLEGLRDVGPACFFLALGIALYTEGLVRGRIALVILLFYLTPVWSTLLARIVLGVPVSGRRLATLGLGLSGMLVVFGLGGGAAAPPSAGEWMGLAAGLTWAVALVGFRREGAQRIFDLVFAHFVFLGPLFLLAAWLPGGGAERFALRLEARSLVWLLVFALVWMLPVVWLTVYGAAGVEPGRFAVLLMLEIAVGLGSAALLTDEPFGLREAAGAALILGALGVEIGPPPGRARESA